MKDSWLKVNRRQIVVIVIFMCFLLLVIWTILYVRWSYLWEKEETRPFLKINHRHDDTLRVGMIGDSWVVGRSWYGMDSTLQISLSKILERPVIVNSKGKGGEKSRGVYCLLFEEGKDGLRQIITMSPNYCVVMVGINDAAANLGVEQFLHHYRLILDLLFHHQICPIVIEIPDVDIWYIYGKKPYKDLLIDYIRSIMTGCRMYYYAEYRKALYKMLTEKDILKSVIYIPMKSWNGQSTNINEKLFLSDRIHLNKNGYERLDSCIALSIIERFQKNVYHPVCNNPEKGATEN